MKPAYMRRSMGLTLIELLVALTIFAILGALSWRALSEASLSQSRLEEGFQRWRSLVRSIQRIDSDLLLIVSTPGRAGPVMVKTDSSELQLLRIDPETGIRRSGFRVLDGKLQSFRWNGREALGPPDSETMLDGVRSLGWSFLHDGVRIERWPPPGKDTVMPDAVIVNLDLVDIGTITRIVPLR
ncbi:MAG: type II secretion system protein GspJ [Azonexus sp.]|nr:type II secretion system protein GspJ [Azonexus sp.]